MILDREVLSQLSRLPSYQPTPEFANRVMARVVVGSPAPVPVLSFPRFTRRRIAALTALAAGMVASVAWSAANRALLDGWLTGAEATLWQWGQMAWQAGLGYLTSQPWFENVRGLTGTPVRLVAVATVILGLWGSGLFALRRLVSPAGSVPHAGA